MSERSTLTRIGVAALNFPAPGLGLLRVGEARLGLAFLATPTIALLITSAAFAVLPTMTFAGAIALAVILLAIALAALVLSTYLTWRQSALRAPILPWWSRWYGLLLAFVVVSVASTLGLRAAHHFYKPFYIPAESMAPTLDKDDKMVADMRGGRNPAIGDLVLVSTPDAIYVKRVAALAGDHVAMRAGVPIINGRAANQRRKGSIRTTGLNGPETATLLVEQLPGERTTHEILDIEETIVDEIPEQIVPPGHIFLLGDNRDRSSDSRLSPEQQGLGMVAVTRIVGRPLFIHWSPDRSKIGRNLTR